MSDSITERTPLVIAVEVNTIKHQTEKVVLNNAIEIGRRLKEAKDLIPYGEWSKWLAESVSYTERTAQKLMLVFDAYGDKQPAALNAGAPTQRPPNMNYTQALILLGVPEEEREQFIAEIDIENMSVRELQKAGRIGTKLFRIGTGPCRKKPIFRRLWTVKRAKTLN